MADKKISELPALPTPIQTTDFLVVVRSGNNFKADKEDLPTGGSGGSGGPVELNDDFVI